jgi:hypothetical protein
MAHYDPGTTYSLEELLSQADKLMYNFGDVERTPFSGEMMKADQLIASRIRASGSSSG